MFALRRSTPGLAVKLARAYSSDPKILRPKDKTGMPRAKLNMEPKAAKGNISDYDMYDELAKPLNNIETVLKDGFKLASDHQVVSPDPNSPQGLVLIGSESFKVDLTGAIENLDKGIVDISPEALSIFEVVDPIPELLVVGLGGKSRILGQKTSAYLHSLGMQLQVSNTANGCSNFDLLATERPMRIGALLFPPNL